MPHLDFQRVKQEISIPQIFEKFDIDFKEHRGRIRMACPLPSHKANPIKRNQEQFVADSRKKIWQWVCFSTEDHGVSKPLGGSVIELVMHLAQLDSYKHVRLWFLDRFSELGENKSTHQRSEETVDQIDPKEEASEDAQQEHSSPAQNTTSNLLDLNPPLKPLKWFYNLDQNAKYLLEDRDLTPKTIERFGFGLVTRENTYLSGYIAIPIYLPGQKDGENPVSYLGRFAGKPSNWSDETPRYKFWDGFPRNQVIYGLREALRDSDPNSSLVVTEGPLTAAMISQKTNLQTIVATFGACLSDNQANILRATQRDIIWLWDGGTEQATNQALGMLCREFVRVKAIFLPDGNKPDELSSNELKSLLRSNEVPHD